MERHTALRIVITIFIVTITIIIVTIASIDFITATIGMLRHVTEPLFIAGPACRLTIKARRRLDNLRSISVFAVHLRRYLEALSVNTSTVCFSDFDISQNKIPFEGFQHIIDTFKMVGCQVQRARFFGCATLDDQVCELIADWIRGMTSKTMIHLA